MVGHLPFSPLSPQLLNIITAFVTDALLLRIFILKAEVPSVYFFVIRHILMVLFS